MSGALTPFQASPFSPQNGQPPQRPLFADAPMVQMQPGQPAQGDLSPLARALMGNRGGMPNMPAPNFGGGMNPAAMAGMMQQRPWTPMPNGPPGGAPGQPSADAVLAAPGAQAGSMNPGAMSQAASWLNSLFSR